MKGAAIWHPRCGPGPDGKMEIDGPLDGQVIIWLNNTWLLNGCMVWILTNLMLVLVCNKLHVMLNVCTFVWFLFCWPKSIIRKHIPQVFQVHYRDLSVLSAQWINRWVDQFLLLILDSYFCFGSLFNLCSILLLLIINFQSLSSFYLF